MVTECYIQRSSKGQRMKHNKQEFIETRPANSFILNYLLENINLVMISWMWEQLWNVDLFIEPQNRNNNLRKKNWILLSPTFYCHLFHEQHVLTNHKSSRTKTYFGIYCFLMLNIWCNEKLGVMLFAYKTIKRNSRTFKFRQT